MAIFKELKQLRRFGEELHLYMTDYSVEQSIRDIFFIMKKSKIGERLLHGCVPRRSTHRKDCLIRTLPQQFSLSYGPLNGYGSPINSAHNNKTPQITKNVYSQYKNILLNPDDKRFTFTRKVNNSFVGYDADYCHFINFSTSQSMKERIDEGNFLFTLGVSVQ